MSTFRAFIAFLLPADTGQQITKLQIEYAQLVKNQKMRWLPIGNIHLTLKFLGDIEEGIVPEINQSSSNICADADRVLVNLAAIQLFPTSNRARGIWIKFDRSAQLLSLQKKIDNRLAKVGIAKSKRAYAPHLTIARFRRGITKLEIHHINQVISSYDANLLQ